MRLKTLALALFAVAGLSLGAASTAFADDNKCNLPMEGNSPTKQACEKGGKKEAAKTMKAMVKAAKAKGVVFVCDDCHKNNDDYKLTDNAKKDYEKLLAAYK